MVVSTNLDNIHDIMKVDSLLNDQLL